LKKEQTTTPDEILEGERASRDWKKQHDLGKREVTCVKNFHRRIGVEGRKGAKRGAPAAGSGFQENHFREKGNRKKRVISRKERGLDLKKKETAML